MSEFKPDPIIWEALNILVKQIRKNSKIEQLAILEAYDKIIDYINKEII